MPKLMLGIQAKLIYFHLFFKVIINLPTYSGKKY